MAIVNAFGLLNASGVIAVSSAFELETRPVAQLRTGATPSILVSGSHTIDTQATSSAPRESKIHVESVPFALDTTPVVPNLGPREVRLVASSGVISLDTRVQDSKRDSVVRAEAESSPFEVDTRGIEVLPRATLVVAESTAFSLDTTVSPGPTLQAVIADSLIQLSWGSSEVQYLLEQSATLSPASWSLVESAPRPTPAGFTVMLPLEGAGSRFFRLTRIHQ